MPTSRDTGAFLFADLLLNYGELLQCTAVAGISLSVHVKNAQNFLESPACESRIEALIITNALESHHLYDDCSGAEQACLQAV